MISSPSSSSPQGSSKMEVRGIDSCSSSSSASRSSSFPAESKAAFPLAFCDGAGPGPKVLKAQMKFDPLSVDVLET